MTYVREWAREEEPMGDTPSFENAVALLGAAGILLSPKLAVLNYPHSPQECVVIGPQLEGELPEVWINDTDEADGGWYVVFNRILAAKNYHWRFRMPSWNSEEYVNEYLMVLRCYDKEDPRTQRFSVLED